MGHAAQDAHDVARNVLRRMVRRRRHPDAVLAEPGQRILVARDFSRELALHIPTEATDEALEALAGLDFPAPTPNINTANTASEMARSATTTALRAAARELELYDTGDVVGRTRCSPRI
ncbi:hypothetical protein [Streptomyces sp. NBC_00576]|uniref:hypothetical protein n=1 Tax=Streptomyces sp. NBC_00576 TaxID=2903665 RepID=UPI002E8000B7|nr:hypothetical protein [Streptomyces sp. NBC_00576]WUB68873.1 hypothetical protein OG734_01535 [Streptomyces sp. NBC_00576]